MHIWINLLDNAIKFSPSKGTITMFLKQEQDSVKSVSYTHLVHAFYEPEELVGKTLLAIVNLPPRSMMGIDSEGMLINDSDCCLTNQFFRLVIQMCIRDRLSGFFLPHS